MSDIYLQITETPTVVTLSAPVISGSLTSTVTVANVVTVALDSNSLSALENVTVTVGAAITGTVTVSNFPASQAVTFSAVTISNFPATQTIAGTVTVGSLPAISGTVTANLSSTNLNTVTIGVRGSVTVGNTTQITDSVVSGFNNVFGNSDTFKVDIRTPAGSVLDGEASVPVQGTVDIGSLPAISGTVTVGNTVTIAGTVTANNSTLTNVLQYDGSHYFLKVGGVATTGGTSFPVYVAGAVTANLGEVSSIGGGEPPTKAVAIGFEQTDGGIFRAVDSDWPLPISGTVTVGNSVTIASLPAISGTVTANTFALQGTAVTTSNFTSTTASTVLANFNATREVLTIFNEGAGNLHICAGATCTTIAYQVRLSAGDYYEVPNHQTTITHSAVFATAGTARVTEVS